MKSKSVNSTYTLDMWLREHIWAFLLEIGYGWVDIDRFSFIRQEKRLSWGKLTPRAERVLVSESKPFDDWNLSLSGLDPGTLWENMIAQIGGIDLTGGKDLGETIATNEHCNKLMKQIATLDKKTMNERQPRRKWEYAEKIVD